MTENYSAAEQGQDDILFWAHCRLNRTSSVPHQATTIIFFFG